MNPTRKVTRRIMLAIAVIAIGTAASCNLMNTDIIDFEYTGRVLDADTKEPIEGAFALAVYEQVDLGMAGAARYCIKTKGMLTDKDGKFHFPIDKLNGTSPSNVAAIKANYYSKGSPQISEKVWKAQNKETYMNRDVYLKKQDAAKPKFGYGFTYCQRPESRDGIEAAIQFLQIEIDDSNKFGRDVRSTNSVAGLVSAMKEDVANQTYNKKK